MATLCPVSRGRTYMSEMTDLSGPGPAEPRSGSRQGPHGPDAVMSAEVMSAEAMSPEVMSAAADGAAQRSQARSCAKRLADQRPADRLAADRRQQRPWVPLVASWLMRLVGLADI